VWQAVQTMSDLKHMFLIKFKQLVERLAKAAPAKPTDAAADSPACIAVTVEHLTDEAMGGMLQSALTNSKRLDALDAAHRKAIVDSCVDSVQLPHGTFTCKSKLSWSLVDDKTKALITCPFCPSQIKNRFRRCKSTGTVQLDLGNLLNHFGKQHPEQAPFPKEASPEHPSNASTPNRTTPAKSRKRNRTTTPSASESPSSAASTAAASSSSSASSSAPPQLSLLEMLTQSHP
jgi:hypothetical protein